MSLHSDFPTSPYAPLLPEQRWFPADEALRATAYEKLLPPLVAKIREEVCAWRATGYLGASDTSRALLRHWFQKDHLLESADGSLSPFSYYVLKMVTGAGKTKVISLLIAWSFFHKLTIEDTGTTRIEDRIRLRNTRPFRTEHRPYIAARKSIFTKIVGEPHSCGFELSFAAFLEGANDVAAFAKNYLAVGFKLDYVKRDGDLSNYTPGFMVRTTDGMIWILETKGREELDLPQKMARLKQWCADATAAEEDGQRYDFVFVDQKGFEKHAPQTFAALAASFTEYKG